MAKKRFNFSPQDVHSHLMETVKPSMGFTAAIGRGRKTLANWQRKLRAEIKQRLGWGNMPQGKQRCRLNVRSLWKRDHKLGTIEKIVFTAEPKADVPAYVCLPKGVRPPYTWFICVQGHSTGMHNSIAVDLKTNTKHIKAEGDRDFGLTCMARGMAALCIEQRGFGERFLNYGDGASHSDSEAAMHALQLGRTLIGERVYDVDRGLDYLAARKDVRRSRIGVMGNSGGGTITTFSAAVLPRIKLAMPSCYFCTFKHSIMAMSHCGCNFVPGLLRVAEMADVLGTFAPRPVVVVTGKYDPIFPLHATKSEFRRLKRIYAAAGAPGNCKLVVGDGEHRFYAKQGWDAMGALLGL